ncbi:MAG: DNA-directed RNA polymerase subunit omega [Candidatus Omnitrophota bacterium]|nr:MAG: DNA-directed RNA polymerase subunit omega [Candidatus Omnitrophota bacterium]
MSTMMFIPEEELLKKVGGMYNLTRLVFERAKQLSKGAQKLVDIDSSNFITIALEEIRQGKLDESK